MLIFASEEIEPRSNTWLHPKVIKAVQTNNIDRLDELVERGYAIEGDYYDGDSLLHTAVRFCADDMVYHLLTEYDFCTAHKNNSGMRAYDLARSYVDEPMYETIREVRRERRALKAQELRERSHASASAHKRVFPHILTPSHHLPKKKKFIPLERKLTPPPLPPRRPVHAHTLDQATLAVLRNKGSLLQEIFDDKRRSKEIKAQQTYLKTHPSQNVRDYYLYLQQYLNDVITSAKSAQGGYCCMADDATRSQRTGNLIKTIGECAPALIRILILGIAHGIRAASDKVVAKRIKQIAAITTTSEMASVFVEKLARVLTLSQEATIAEIDRSHISTGRGFFKREHSILDRLPARIAYKIMNDSDRIFRGVFDATLPSHVDETQVEAYSRAVLGVSAVSQSQYCLVKPT